MYEIIGVKNVDYVSKKTGNRVTGFNLFVTHEEDGVEGLASDRIFVSTSNIDFEPAVGVLCDVRYNRFGSVESVIEVN